MAIIKRTIFRIIYFMVSVLHIAVSLIIGASAWGFNLLALLLLAVTVCCYFMGIESGTGIKHMLIGCGILFAIPVAANFIDAVLVVTKEIIADHL